MITQTELRELALDRIKDAEVLLNGQRYDGSVYLCGYTIELWLKETICKTLRWSGFPATNNEFKDYQSFKTHKLDILLRLSGKEDIVKNRHFNEWSCVQNWNPENRYETANKQHLQNAQEMLESTTILVNIK